MAERGGFEPPVQVLARTTVSQSAALFVEVEPNGFADRWTGKNLNRDKMG